MDPQESESEYKSISSRLPNDMGEPDYNHHNNIETLPSIQYLDSRLTINSSEYLSLRPSLSTLPKTSTIFFNENKTNNVTADENKDYSVSEISDFYDSRSRLLVVKREEQAMSETTGFWGSNFWFLFDIFSIEKILKIDIKCRRY